MKPIAMTPATNQLDLLGITYELHKYISAEKRGFGVEAANALSVSPDRIFKTIIFTDSKDIVVGVSPVSAEISRKKLAAAIKVRNVESVNVQLAERVTGYVIGGISPLGQRQPHLTVLDESALIFPTIFVSGGRRGLEIEIAASDLITALQALCAPIAAWGPAKC
jgi:Cys-tRNA(Pro)/Cys-tRNA(Cys) deacylase